MKRLVETLNPGASAEVILTGGASRISRRVMDAIGIESVEDASLTEADAMVVLDASTLRQLGAWGEKLATSEVPKVFVDHHAPSPKTRELSTILLADEESTSTCEIVYRLFRSYEVNPSPDVARALLIGIAYDSRHFTLGTTGTFEAVSDLLKLNGPIGDVTDLLTLEMDRSERVARLKAAQRMQIHDLAGWIIATSNVGSFQASACRGLLSLGADVAVVAGSDRGTVKVSLRSTNKFYEGTHIHLGRDVAMPLGEEFGGAGSGHSSSAGLNAEGSVQSMLRRAVELISGRLQRGI